MINLVSTKILTPAQRKLFPRQFFRLQEYDAIEITPVAFEIPPGEYQLIFTSKNAVRSFFNNSTPDTSYRCYCVGEKTKQLLEDLGQKVVKTAENSAELGSFLVKKVRNAEFLYPCGNLSRPELPEILIKGKIGFFPLIVYKTVLKPQKIRQKPQGILFFSPSGVKSHTGKNQLDNTTAFCIGTTTAAEVRKFTDSVVIATKPSTEDLIKTIITHYQPIAK